MSEPACNQEQLRIEQMRLTSQLMKEKTLRNMSLTEYIEEWIKVFEKIKEATKL